MDDAVRDVLVRFGLPAAALAVVAAIGVAAVTGPGKQAGRAPVLTASPTPAPAATESPTASPTPSPTPSASATAAPTSPVTRPPTRAVVPTTAPARAMPPHVRCGRTGPMTDGYVTGTVVDGAGRPVRDIFVQGASCVGPELRDGMNLTDAAGRFAVPCVMGSRTHEHWMLAAPFRLYSGARTTQADVSFAWLNGVAGRVTCGTAHRVVLAPEGVLRARLVEPSGSPSTASYRFVVFTGRGTGGEEIVGLSPDERGEMTFAGLAPGTYTLYSSGEGDPGDPETEMAETFTITAGRTTEVTVTVRRKGAGTGSPSPAPSGSAGA